MTHKTDASYNDNIFRKDFYMIIAANRHLASFKAINTDSVDALKPGQVMARVVSTGIFQKYSAASGVGHDSVCVLFDELSTNEATGTSILRAVFGGELYKSELIELDANAISEMVAKEITDGKGTEIVKF